MLPKAMNLTSWDQMKGKPVCDVTGSYYNRPAAEKFGVELVGFTGVTEALTAMQQGRCVGLLFDDTAIIGQIAKPQWSGYDMPLPSQDAQPWGIAVKQGATALKDQVHDTIVAWNKEGTIIQLRICPEGARRGCEVRRRPACSAVGDGRCDLAPARGRGRRPKPRLPL